MIIDTLISAQPFGREMPLSFVWEKIVAWWNYRGAPELVPARAGLFEGTPIVNDEFIGHVKNGKCQYVRADIERFTKGGVRVKVRGREDKPGEGKEEKEVCVLRSSSTRVVSSWLRAVYRRRGCARDRFQEADHRLLQG